MPEEAEASEDLFFLDFMMVTFSNLMESKGRVDGEMGNLSEKMSRYFRRERSLKDGEEIGL